MTSAELYSALEGALDAARDLDDLRFSQTAELAIYKVPCLDEPMTPELASTFHLVRAVQAFYDGDRRQAQLSFAAARAWTFYELDETLLPEGTPIREAHDQDPPPTRFVRFDQPLQGSLTIDGVRRPDRPDARPLVSQYLSSAGGVQQTDIVSAGAALPVLRLTVPVVATAEAPPPPPQNDNNARQRRRYPGPNGPMLALSAVALAGAGALYYFSLEQRDTWEDPNTPTEDLEDARLAHNRMLAGAWGSGGLAVGLGLGAFVVGAF